MSKTECTICQGSGKITTDETDETCSFCYGSGIDVWYSETANCPYCGHAHESSACDIYQSEKNFSCENCNKKFDIEADIQITFSTFKAD